MPCSITWFSILHRWSLSHLPLSDFVILNSLGKTTAFIKFSSLLIPSLHSSNRRCQRRTQVHSHAGWPPFWLWLWLWLSWSWDPLENNSERWTEWTKSTCSGLKGFARQQPRQDLTGCNHWENGSNDEILTHANFFYWARSNLLCGEIQPRKKETDMLGGRRMCWSLGL